MPSGSSAVTCFGQGGEGKHSIGNNADDVNEIHGVRYATFWKMNNMQRLAVGGFYKQQECCYDSSHQPKCSHEAIHPDQKHFVNDIRSFVNDENIASCPMRMYSYKEVADSFSDKDFLQESGMGINETNNDHTGRC